MQRQPYSITSSVRASSVGGIVSPSAWAVTRLIVRSNLTQLPDLQSDFTPELACVAAQVFDFA
jgi:hypothetical protein